ncbi:hypothetical protein S83_024412, partial [Arachis hypogaea]
KVKKGEAMSACIHGGNEDLGFCERDKAAEGLMWWRVNTGNPLRLKLRRHVLSRDGCVLPSTAPLGAEPEAAAVLVGALSTSFMYPMDSHCVVVTAIALYYISTKESYLYTPLSGFYGVISGFLVGIKQIVPDQELPLIKIKAKLLLSRNDRFMLPLPCLLSDCRRHYLLERRGRRVSSNQS